MLNLGMQDNRTLNIFQIIRKVSRRGLIGTIKYISKQGAAEIWSKTNLYLKLGRVHRINRRYDKCHNVDTLAWYFSIANGN